MNHATQGASPAEAVDPSGRHEFDIQIDRCHYKVATQQITGLELRRLLTPPIAPDRDIFEVGPGGPDRKVSDEDTVELRDGLRFFTVPTTISAGKW